MVENFVSKTTVNFREKKPYQYLTFFLPEKKTFISVIKNLMICFFDART